MFGRRVLYRVSAISTQFCSDSGIALKSKVYYITMGKRCKETSHQGRYTDSKETTAKKLNITCHQGISFENKNEIPVQIYENCENPKYPYTAGESWCLPSFSEIPIRSPHWHSHRCSESGKTTNKPSSHSLKTQK